MSNPFWNIAGTTAAAAQVGFMPTYQHQFNILGEIIVSEFFQKYKNNKKNKKKKKKKHNFCYF